jgi:SagB-type dehydrogenase family enzyme
MNRRTFLKGVPALTMLAATAPGLTEDANTKSSSTPEMQAGLQTNSAVQLDIIKLNPPDLNKGISVMQALKKRKTQRDITDKKLTLQQLSDLLWAADGINRPDGKRTAPAAIAIYSVDIYAVLPEGVYFYDVAKHELKPVAKGDFRKLAGMQDFVFIAPVNLVYVLNLKGWRNAQRPVSDEKRDLWVHVEVGLVAQNINLYCASEGLGATVRGMIDQKKFSEVIKVRPEQVVLAHTIGYPK